MYNTNVINIRYKIQSRIARKFVIQYHIVIIDFTFIHMIYKIIIIIIIIILYILLYILIINYKIYFLI